MKRRLAWVPCLLSHGRLQGHLPLDPHMSGGPYSREEVAVIVSWAGVQLHLLNNYLPYS